MGLLSWVKKHPWETAAIVSGSVLTGGAAGVGPAAGLFGGEAAAGAGAVAGDAFLPGALAGTEGLAGGAGFGGAAEAGAEAFGATDLFGSLLAPSASSFAQSMLAAPSMTPMITNGMMGAEPFAQGAVTASSGTGGLFGPSVKQAQSALNWKDALQLAKMSGLGQQQQQQPLGAPQDYGNPMQRQAMLTQEQITKK